MMVTLRKILPEKRQRLEVNKGNSIQQVAKICPNFLYSYIGDESQVDQIESKKQVG